MYTTNPKYKEILKLNAMLTEANIPHMLRKFMDGWQVGYPVTPDFPGYVMDAIEHKGSYGNGRDLLEIRGLLTPEEEMVDSVLGELTAEEVFERIKKHHDGKWDEPKKKIYTRDEAMQIIELFEDVLSEYNIKVPSPEDDEREPDNDAALYGSTYSDLLDIVERRLIDMLYDHGPDVTVVTDMFSGCV